MKRILSVILTLAMLLVPMAAFAEEAQPETIVSNETITVSNGDDYWDWGGELVAITPEKNGTLTITATAADTESPIKMYAEGNEMDTGFDAYAGDFVGEGASITYTAEVKSGIEYNFYFWGGKSDHTGDVTYSATLTPGEAVEIPASWENPKVINHTASVTIPAGGIGYYNYADPDAASTQHTVTVDGVMGFELIQATDMYYDEEFNLVVTENAIKDNEGTATYTAEGGFFGINATFAIKNNTENDQTYYVTVRGVEGTISNPFELEIKDGITTGPSFAGYYFTYTAVNNGTLKLNMTSDYWEYSVLASNETSVNWENIQSSASEGNATIEIELATFDTVRIWVAGDTTFNAIMEQAYAVSSTELVLGTNHVTPLPNTGTTIYPFSPEKDGIYKFETEEGLLIGYWGGSAFFLFDGTENKTNTLEHEFSSAGQTGYFGISTDKEFTITITRIGDRPLTPSDFPVINHTCKHTPIKSDWEGKWTWVNVVDDIKDSAVLGADGFYHLNSANGPILFVDLSSTRYDLDLAEANNFGQLKYTIQIGDQEWERGQYKEVFNTYYEAGPVVALTDELIDLFQKVGEDQGWYEGDFTLFGETAVDPKEAWMFACKYVKADEVDSSVEGVDENNGYDKADKNDFAIIFDDSEVEFAALYHNGVLVDPANYTVDGGKVTIKASYLANAEIGENTFVVVFDNENVVSATINVTGTIGALGDFSNGFVYTILLLGVAVLVIAVAAKKKLA